MAFKFLLFQENNEGYTLATANRLYTQTGFETKNEFSSILSKSFHAEAQRLDFAKSAESATTINKWVEEATRDKIKNLISSGMTIFLYN
jgi:serpin B